MVCDILDIRKYDFKTFLCYEYQKKKKKKN